MIKLIYSVAGILALGVFVATIYFSNDDFIRFYEDKMRVSLFAGFLTLSGFLFSAKTFIILSLKREMISTKAYLKQFQLQSRLMPTLRESKEQVTIEVYRPLRNIGHVLLINVALCLAASLFQFTIGICASRITVAICLAAAAAAFGMLVFSLVVIARNLHDMYDHFEEEARNEIKSMPPISDES